jgi:hypothetical protein
MKTMVLLTGIAVLMGVGSGCAKNYRLENDWGATPAYSSSERYQQINRNWDYEGKQATDDVDHFLLLRPASHLTVWNVQ